MSTTYRAAYIPAKFGSNSGGLVLTLPEHAGLSDEAMIEAARPALAEMNDSLRAIGEEPHSEADISIGDWTE